MRIIAAGVSVLVVVCSAQAQTARLAEIDESGRVVPVTADSAKIETIGRVASLACSKVQPLAPDDARALISRIATEERFSAELALSVAKVESHFNAIARSDKGAFGLMQLMPETARRFRVTLCDPADNVRGGIRYLQALSVKYPNPFYVLAAYNAGEDAVDRNRGVPPYAETVRFVAQVINNLNGWATPGAPPLRELRNASTSVADLIEPSQSNPSSVTSSPSPRQAAQWSDGSVMHVE